jgi:hypothetical protein
MRPSVASIARSARLALLPAAMAALLAACAATSGIGGGEMKVPGKEPLPVLISWTSDAAGLSGEMVATLPATTYRGRYFQVTDAMAPETLSPLWVDWPSGWKDWAGGIGATDVDPGNVQRFIERYTGQVVASLHDRAGVPMRCRLRLQAPRLGLAGGGAGECQVQGGASFRARF